MYDRSLSIHHVLAATCWVVAFLLVVASFITGIIQLGHLGLMATAGAAVSNIRGFICRATTRVAESQENVMDLARDYVQGGRVRNLR